MYRYMRFLNCGVFAINEFELSTLLMRYARDRAAYYRPTSHAKCSHV